jgi:hypothetical protein
MSVSCQHDARGREGIPLWVRIGAEQLTVLQIFRTRVKRSGYHGEIDLLELFPLDAGPFRQTFFRVLEFLTLISNI